ncbi:uncharacterized protein LOC120334871 [Styela clava]
MAGAGVFSPLSNRVFILNFFEKSGIPDEDFIAHWMDAAKYVEKQQHYISTHLHKALGASARFSWVNFAAFDSNDVCVFGKPDPIWGERMKRAASSNKLTAYPGEYYEIASYNGNPLTTDDKKKSEKARFLLTAVKADESISREDLETNWKSWMKTDFIHQQLKENDNLKDSLLYRMAKARNPMIRYAVRTELSEMDEKQGIELAQLVNQQKCQEGVETFTGFYCVHTNM